MCIRDSIKTPTVTRSEDTFTPTFAPKQKKGLGIIDLGLMLATGGLFGTKAKTLAQTYGAINRTKNLVSDLSNTFGFEDPIANMFSGNKKSTKNTTTKDEDIFTGGGDGIEGLGNNDALNQEYLLLLNKFNTGVFTDADQVRFTFLQK